MIKLIPIFLISCICAWLSSISSDFNVRRNRYEQKDKFFFFIIIVVMTVFVGLRTRYNDTTTYLEAYEYQISATGNLFVDLNFFEIGGNPGFMLINRILKHIGFSKELYLMFFSILTVPVYLWFIKKYTTNIFMSVYLLYAMGIYTFTLAAIKQCLAVAFGLIAIDCFINKRKFSFVLVILIGCTIHPYVLMFLVVPLLRFKPWTKSSYWMLFIFLAFGISLQLMMGRIIDVTSMLGKEYSSEELSGAGVNFFRFAVAIVPLVLSFMLRKNIGDEFYDEPNCIIMNLSMLNSLFMFVALFGTANYFGRLANYFLIFQAISLPWLLRFVDSRYKSLLTLTAVVCYFLYFYYENAGLNVGYRFDDLFDRITVKKFFEKAFIFKNN